MAAFVPKSMRNTSADADAERFNQVNERAARDGLLDDSSTPGQSTPPRQSASQQVRRSFRPGARGDGSGRAEAPSGSGMRKWVDEAASQGSSGARDIDKSVRARRLVLEVAAFMTWGVTQVREKEYAARRDPDGVIKEMTEIIEKVIRPSRKSVQAEMDRLVAERPGESVFSITKDGRTSVLNRPATEENGMMLFHGNTLHAVDPATTPFGSLDVFDRFKPQDAPKPKP